MPLAELADVLRPAATRTDFEAAFESTESGELTEVATMIAADLVARIQVLIDLGLGLSDAEPPHPDRVTG